MKIATAGEMQRIDAATIAEYGIPGRVLMERAGLAVVDSILERTAAEEQILVVAGKGNNGGDGFVIARELKRLGRAVRVILLADPGDLKVDARANYDAALKHGVAVRPVTKNFTISSPKPGLIVDAILGTGLSSPLRGLVLEAVGAINRAKVPVVAVDLPTGVSSDSGEILGDSVNAAWTVAMGLPKRGHFLYPGAGSRGELIVADIGFPGDLLNDAAIPLETIDEAGLRGLLPRRRADAHKGLNGHVLVVAGSRHMKGAAVMVALSSFRAGAGLVTVAAPESVLDRFPRDLMEAMTVSLPESPGGAIDPDGCALLLEAAKKADAVAVGPGLSREPEVEQVVEAIVGRCPKPLVIDADGINALESRAAILRRRKRNNVVLTPHPAEMGRLLGTTTVSVQTDRCGTVLSAVEKTGGKTIVLKGPGSLVSGAAGRIHLNTSGNDGLATAGSGDVLTGITATLLAQGLAPCPAARLAVWVHGRAADLAAETVTRRALMPRDVIRRVPEVLASLDIPGGIRAARVAES